MKICIRSWFIGLWIAAASCISGTAVAQQVEGSLVDLITSGRYDFNRLERQAAIANQAVYNGLAPLCDVGAAPGASCSAQQAALFGNIRELVENANELLGRGPTQFSLALNEAGLGFALRWTAVEELAAQGTAGSEFANNQLTSLMSRMTALRQGARGFSVVNVAPGSDSMLADMNRPLGGGASADDALWEGSRWGGFLDGSYGWGDRDPTDVEDAFNFDSTEVTAGVDYRFTPRFVLGGIVGHTQQKIDFDSSRSIVGGGIESEGYSVIIYGLHEWDGPYLGASIGWQRLSLDTLRRITYPSFNPDVESTDATARGTTNSTTLSATFNTGWNFHWRAFGVEPYVRAEYREMQLDAFSENSVNISGTQTGVAAGFDFAVGDQVITSLDTAIGFRIQYVLTPSFGVVVPYLKIEHHRQLEDDAHQVDATYANLGNVSPETPFDLTGDKPDSSFQVAAAGFSLVLKHGWQGFLQYQTVQGMDLLSNYAITGGIRTEF